MKIQKSTFEKKSTKSYSDFLTYEKAEYNLPYIAAIFNKSFINNRFFNFTLGKHAFYELSKVTNSGTFTPQKMKSYTEEILNGNLYFLCSDSVKF